MTTKGHLHLAEMEVYELLGSLLQDDPAIWGSILWVPYVSKPPNVPQSPAMPGRWRSLQTSRGRNAETLNLSEVPGLKRVSLASGKPVQSWWNPPLAPKCALSTVLFPRIRGGGGGQYSTLEDALLGILMGLHGGKLRKVRGSRVQRVRRASPLPSLLRSGSRFPLKRSQGQQEHRAHRRRAPASVILGIRDGETPARRLEKNPPPGFRVIRFTPPPPPMLRV